MRKNTILNSNCIDNVVGDRNIANLFAKKYEQLYNSVKYDEQLLSAIISENIDDIGKKM